MTPEPKKPPARSILADFESRVQAANKTLWDLMDDHLGERSHHIPSDDERDADEVFVQLALRDEPDDNGLSVPVLLLQGVDWTRTHPPDATPGEIECGVLLTLPQARDLYAKMTEWGFGAPDRIAPAPEPTTDPSA